MVPGTQRRARDDAAGTLPDAGRPADPTPADPEQPPESSPAATAVSVPAEVRRAVAEVAGAAPETAMVHIGDHASDQADAVNAEAFTREGEIYLASDADLDTARGRALLAHELTHVVQQDGGQKAMPDERSDEGQAHERAALQVERAMARPPRGPQPVDLHHPGGVTEGSAGSAGSAGTAAVSPVGAPVGAPVGTLGAPAGGTRASRLDAAATGSVSGDEPAQVPPGVQRRSRAAGEGAPDDVERMPLPPIPVMDPPRPSVLQPSLKEQVDLVHAGRSIESGADLAGQMAASGLQRPEPVTANRPAPGSAGLAPISSSVSLVSSEDGGAAARAGSDGQVGGGQAPAQSTLEKGLGYFSRMMVPPEGPSASDDESSRGELERQADSLYPFLRSRLRAELVRDLERRGRMTREWR